MNPYLLLGAVLFWIASTVAALIFGVETGRTREVARQAELTDAIEQTRTAAMEGAADAISKIKITNTTIRGKTETIVRENVVYRDCLHPTEQLRNVNEALTGRPEPFSDRKLPTVNGVN